MINRYVLYLKKPLVVKEGWPAVLKLEFTCGTWQVQGAQLIFLDQFDEAKYTFWREEVAGFSEQTADDPPLFVNRP